MQAPEVFEEKYGPKADIWSVGGLIYQMASGSPPWKSLGFKNPISLFFHLKSNDSPPKLSSLKPTSSIDEGDYCLLENVICRCFQRDPVNRPSASTMLKDAFFETYGSYSRKSQDQTHNNETYSSKHPVATVSQSDESIRNSTSIIAQKALDLRVTENDSMNVSMADSLCYSMTLSVPLPKVDMQGKLNDNHDAVDMSEWPQWAKQINVSKSNKHPFCIEQAEKENVNESLLSSTRYEGKSTNLYAKQIEQNPFARTNLKSRYQ